MFSSCVCHADADTSCERVQSIDCCVLVLTQSALQVAVCPDGQARGYTYCIPSEDRLEAGLLTRSFMETRMVIGMAGRRAPAHVCAKHDVVRVMCMCTVSLNGYAVLGGAMLAPSALPRHGAVLRMHQCQNRAMLLLTSPCKAAWLS